MPRKVWKELQKVLPMDLDGEIAGGVFFVPNFFLFYFPLETCITCMLGKHVSFFQIHFDKLEENRIGDKCKGDKF